ncbi:polar amino acid ABC transporter permease [Chromatiales bacterium (ex Bugula neritina AB1)]|nr:polar amino acid ABC transporter permease [Chromatiales bacterium (ex Bugula neritina AB1)]
MSRFFASALVSVAVYLVAMGLIIYSAYSGAVAMGYNWQWYRVPKYFYTFTTDGFQWGEISVGLVKTVGLSLQAFLIALLLGIAVALLRLSGLLVGSAIATVFLEVVRNTPLLVLLYLFYYVLGPIFDLDRYTASILCLAVYHAAMISEIFRAGINAVPAGQWEGAKSIGMSTAQSYRYIILPQSVRFMLPPLTGEAVNMIKSSAIVSVIAVAELTTIGRNIISETYMSFEIWFTIAAVYLVVTVFLSVGVSLLERRYANK